MQLLDRFQLLIWDRRTFDRASRWTFDRGRRWTLAIACRNSLLTRTWVPWKVIMYAFHQQPQKAVKMKNISIEKTSYLGRRRWRGELQRQIQQVGGSKPSSCRLTRGTCSKLPPRGKEFKLRCEGRFALDDNSIHLRLHYSLSQKR